MGFTGRSGTLKEKKARKVPDPYAIDSDDMVMVDPPNVEEPPSDRRGHKTRRNKRDSAYMSGALGNEDAVMVDAPRDEMRVTSGPDDIAFVDRPSMRRSDSIKKGGIIGGILGAFAGKPNMERRQSRAVDQGRTYESDYDASRRKRSSAYEEDPAKRLRREDRRFHRSQKSADGEGYPDAGPDDAEDPAAREARRAERRERRERAFAEDPERAARHEARRAEHHRLAQEEEDRRRREERRARHAEREARRPDDDRFAQDEEAKNEERRERRRQRDQMRMDEDAAARPRTERRRSHAPEDDEARRARHEERRMRHAAAEASGDKERPRHSRRRSERPAPVEGYFDRRNGEQPSYGDGAPDDADGAPFMKTGKDKAASWVHSVSDAPPPPIEATIIDAPVHYATDYAPDAMMDDDLTARELRHSRRKANHRHRDLDGYSTEDPEHRRKRQDGAGGRSRGMGGPVNSMGYDTMDGVKTFDGRPALQRGESKAGSWLKKITGL